MCIVPSRQANQKRCGWVIASLRVICSSEQFRLSATPKTTESVRRSCGCPETVPDLRCRAVERLRGEDGGHRWSVKQWSGSRLKCSGNLMVSKLFMKIQDQGSGGQRSRSHMANGSQESLSARYLKNYPTDFS